MPGQVVEVVSGNRHLSVWRGFMVVSEGPAELARLPLDSLAAVIVGAHGVTYSNSLLARLAELKIPLVVCGANHQPAALLWPLCGHHAQAGIMDAQLAAKEPLKKRLWRDIVKNKIGQQGALLEFLKEPSARLKLLAQSVRPGDPGNCEAQASRHYWTRLMGPYFRRDRDQPGLNSFLNYGYMIVRAGLARAVAGAGLHPSLGLHHQNDFNSMRLADDLMEPFRPLVDHLVYQLGQEEVKELRPEIKKRLAGVLSQPMPTPRGAVKAAFVMRNLASSLAQTFLGERGGLELPGLMTPSLWTAGHHDRADEI